MLVALRSTLDRASRSIFTSFDYNTADSFLDEAFVEFKAIPPQELSDPELKKLFCDAHYLKGLILRDRSDARAECHLIAALDASAPNDYNGRRAILSSIATARLNRRDHIGAADALGQLFRSAKGMPVETDDISKLARYYEGIGIYDRATRIMERKVLPRYLGNPEWEATAHTALARQTALSALQLPPQERARKLRIALDHLERGHELLSSHRHDIWILSNRASWGLTSLLVGDRESARFLLRDVNQLIKRVGIRNKWVEELYESLGPDSEGSNSSLSVAWARMYYSRSFSSDRSAYLELERGFEHLLRCAATWDGSEARPQAATRPGMKLWEAANRRLMLVEGFDLRSAVSDQEVQQMLRSRNVAAHQVSPPKSLNFDRECRKLAGSLERLEALLPFELLSQVLGDFRYWRSPQ